MRQIVLTFFCFDYGWTGRKGESRCIEVKSEAINNETNDKTLEMIDGINYRELLIAPPPLVG